MKGLQFLAVKHYSSFHYHIFNVTNYSVYNLISDKSPLGVLNCRYNKVTPHIIVYNVIHMVNNSILKTVRNLQKK